MARRCSCDIEAKPCFPLGIYNSSLCRSLVAVNRGREYSSTSHKIIYLDFSPFSRSFYVIDIYISKQQRLSFPRKVGASLSTPAFSGILGHEEHQNQRACEIGWLDHCTCRVLRIY